MANALVRSGGGGLAARKSAALKPVAKKAAKKSVKKSAKKAAKKAVHALDVYNGSALKKTAQKAVKKAAKKSADHAAKVEQGEKPVSASALLEKAFHHLERAGAVVSLLEEHSGADLRALLRESSEVYRVAYDAKPHDRKLLAVVAGLGQACEHLSIGAMYESWDENRSGLPAPMADDGIATLREKATEAHAHAKGRGEAWLEIALSLLQQAEAEAGNPHLVWELVAAAEGLIEAAKKV